jgi:hypothetical protein
MELPFIVKVTAGLRIRVLTFLKPMRLYWLPDHRQFMLMESRLAVSEILLRVVPA